MDIAIIVVSIDNPRRLNAPTTEDFFLMDIMYYNRAVAALRRCEINERKNPKSGVNTVGGVKLVLDEANVTYMHATEGQKFFFTNKIAPENHQYNE